MPVTEDNVRELLTKVTTNLLPTETIVRSISLAKTRVEAIKKAGVTVTQLEDAQLMYATFLAYQFELTRIVRQMGSLPLDARNTLNDLRNTAKEFLEIIAVNKKGLPLYGLSEGAATTWTEYIEEEEV